MIRLLILMITLTLLAGSAFGNIDHLMRVITGGYGSGARLEVPLANRYSFGPPSTEFSFGYGLGR